MYSPKTNEKSQSMHPRFDILEPITALQGKALWKAYWEIIQCVFIP